MEPTGRPNKDFKDSYRTIPGIENSGFAAVGSRNLEGCSGVVRTQKLRVPSMAWS